MIILEILALWTIAAMLCAVIIAPPFARRCRRQLAHGTLPAHGRKKHESNCS